MNFDSRDTYLAARKQWAAEYNELSKQIRETRKAFNEAQQKYARTLNAVETSKWWSAVEKARGERSKYREVANEMLAERSWSKEEAARQWREMHGK